jgi:predicted metal-dependent phosphoesterase TrpH
MRSPEGDLVTAKGDFHLHSTCSDGRLTPTALMELAAANGVRVLSLTDHDSTEGIAEAQVAAARLGVELVPGVELSTDIPGNEVHILGHFIDWESERFQAAAARFRDGRVGRGKEMVRKLRDLGLMIEWDRVREIAGEASVGRPHVALALREAGYVQTIEEAFDRYIGRNGPAYAEREKLLPEEAVEFIVSCGGLATMAHPNYVENPEPIVAGLKDRGLFGMEVYYKDYSPELVRKLKHIADRHGLLPMGGSDFHGLGTPGERTPGDIPLPDEVVDEFLRRGKAKVAERSTVG